MLRRRCFIATAVVAASLSLSSCMSGGPILRGGGGDGRLDTHRHITLTVQQQTGQERLVGFLAKEFEKRHPNVTVEQQTVSQAQKTGSNLSVLGSSDPPDVGMVPVNSEVYTQLVAAKALVPLDDVWADTDLERRYSKAVASSLRTGGTPYTVNYQQVIYNVVWLNRDALNKAGLKVPTGHRFASARQLAHYATALKTKGYGGLRIGGGSGYQASWMIDALLPTSSTPRQLHSYLNAQRPGVKEAAHYADKPFVRVLDTLDRFAKAGLFQDGFLGQDGDAAQAPFVAGRSGMLLGGDFTSTAVADAHAGFELDYALLPPVDGGTPTRPSLYAGDTMAVPANSDQIAWAKEFLKFTMSDEMQRRAIVEQGGLLPSVNTVSHDELQSLPRITRTLVADVNRSGGQPGWTSVVPGGFGQQFIDPLVQQMYAKTISPSAIGREMDKHLSEYRARAK